MSDEKILRARAREALRTGRLPNARPERIWGGPGIGVRCAVCDEPVEQGQAELEVQFTGHGGASYHVHVRCFAAWEFERQNGHALPDASEQGIMNLDERDAANRAGAG